MKKIKMTTLITLFISIIGVGFNASAQDKVTLNNTSGNEIGLLVDGALNGRFVNDKIYTSTINPAVIGQFSKANGTKTNEIMVFTTDRPMEVYTPTSWTTGIDNISVSFANKILIPVTVWVLHGDFNTVSSKITNDLLYASSIFNNEKVGIDFSTVTFNDATSNPNASNYYTFNYTYQGFSDVKTNIGFVNGQINVYCTQAILQTSGDLKTTIGAVSDAHDMIVLGSTAATYELGHDFCHAFSLYHINGKTGFDQTNYMNNPPNFSAVYLTEGQIARIHLTSSSAINAVYNARPGKVKRDCGFTSSNTCPEHSLRIWADGAFPPNATPLNFQKRSYSIKDIASNWLNLNCFDNDEELNEIEKILQHPELATIFINVIEKGMDPEVIKELNVLAGQLYDRNITMLIDNKPEWVTKEYEDKIRSVSRKQFIANEIATLTSNYKSQAIKGLAILNQATQSNEFFNGMKLTAYPNPAVNEKITIEYTLEKNSDNACLFIFDQTGRRITDRQFHTQSAGSYNVDIETNTLAPGAYFYQLNGNGHSITKKFIVSK